MNNTTAKIVLGTQEWVVVDKYLYPALITAGASPEGAAGIVQRIARNWVLQQEERDIAELKALCKAGLLNKMFTWEATQEGGTYWAFIHLQILKIKAGEE